MRKLRKIYKALASVKAKDKKIKALRAGLEELEYKFCGVENGKRVNAVILKIQDTDGKYKPKTFWFENESDFLRAKQFSLRDTKKVKVVLTIAHLDHDETNHAVSLDRLAALCQYCHLNYDAKEKYRRAGER